MGVQQAITQLNEVLGPDTARQTLEECLGEAGLSDVRSPEDLLALAQAMIKRGGFVTTVGRSLKIEAIIEGAELSALR
jgi:hypothetical protein